MALIPLYPIGEKGEVDFLVGEEWTYLSVYLCGLALLALPRSRDLPRLAALPIFLLAFLALIKHTLLIVSAFIVLAVTFERVRKRELRAGVAIALVYAGSVALIWVLAGQRLANLPEYGLGVLRFTSGYNEAMGLPADRLSTGLGFAVLFGLAGLILLRIAGRTQSAAKSLIDAFFLFIVWKHGFVRGDPQHVAIFFHTSVFLALLFGLAWERPRAEAGAPLLGAPSTPVAVTSAALALFCTLALATTITDAQFRPARLAALWGRNLGWLVSPARSTARLSSELESHKLQFQLKKMRERVGHAPIDFFGYKPGWVLLNDMNYAPRPMPITFAATNESLLRRNEAFYRDPGRAPRFILGELMTIDNRLVSLDDGLALGAILDNYHPLLFGVPRITAPPEAEAARKHTATPPVAVPGVTEVSDDLLLLLERNPPERMREHALRTELETREIGFGEELSLEKYTDQWVWLKVQMRPTLLGRMRALLLRPAAVGMVLDIEGREHPEVRKFVTSMGATGFLISPLIENSRDLFDAYSANTATPATLDRVRAIRFESDPQDRRFFEPRILTRVYAGNPANLQLPARAEAPPGEGSR